MDQIIELYEDLLEAVENPIAAALLCLALAWQGMDEPEVSPIPDLHCWYTKED